MAKRMTVVISQGQSPHPAKRALEEELVTRLLMEAGVEVMVVPHLYDLQPDGTGVLALQGIGGPMIVCSWLFERAARWTLDRHDIRGVAGVTLLKADDEDEEEDENEQEESSAEQAGDDGKERVVDTRPRPARKIYCIDLRAKTKVEPFLEEIKRIVAEHETKVVDLLSFPLAPPPQVVRPTPAPVVSLAPLAPAPSSPVAPGPASAPSAVGPIAAAASLDAGAREPLRVAEEIGRRWYPVIDYSRCTNCMECIDFCLFGVYGVDRQETILVEQPDNCRKGCPACSRVCPENAIIFPQHKTPAIAGAEGVAGALKIDLSALFGAPEGGASAMELAAKERDEQLMLAGRQAVGMTVGMPKRQASAPAGKPDELDSLLDRLDDLDL